MYKQWALNVGVFILGVGCGSLLAILAMKKRYEERYQEELESVKEAFKRTHVYSAEKDIQRAGEGGKPMTSSIKSVPAGSRIAYNEMHKEQMRESLGIHSPLTAKQEADLEPAEEDEDEDYEADEDESDGLIHENVFTKYADLNTPRDLSHVDRTLPYLISDFEFDTEFEEHDKISLYYYRVDDVLCDDGNGVIDDVEETCGFDALAALETAATVWVRNEPLTNDYEIIRIDRSYEDTMMGARGGKSGRAPRSGMSPREEYNRRKGITRDEEEE